MSMSIHITHCSIYTSLSGFLLLALFSFCFQLNMLRFRFVCMCDVVYFFILFLWTWESVAAILKVRYTVVEWNVDCTRYAHAVLNVSSVMLCIKFPFSFLMSMCVFKNMQQKQNKNNLKCTSYASTHTFTR